MNKIIIVLSLAVITLSSSCQSDPGAMTENEKKAMVDSIVGTRMEAINQEAMTDLDRRKSIEVKAKADSIVQAVMSVDTTRPTTVTRP